MQIDADLQDPPEMLELFFECWQVPVAALAIKAVGIHNIERPIY
jgi:hypothetical protein